MRGPTNVQIGTPHRHLRTLTERLVESAHLGTLTVYQGDASETISWAQVHADALVIAANLRDRGYGVGTHVSVLGPTTRHLITTLRAIWLMGGCTIVLPLPMRLGSLDEFTAQTRARILNADTAVVLVDPDFAPFFPAEAGDPPMLALDDDLLTERPGALAFQVPEVDPSSLAILQFTSGSTSAPKGVMLPHGVVCSNLDAIAQACQLQRLTDVAVSWLPLYHDLGLIGLLLVPMTTGTPLVTCGPQDFLAAPSRWMERISAHGGSITAGPNFSYVLAARAMGRSEDLDLSTLRFALNGAEPVDPASVANFVAAGARHGMPAGCVFPAFGMAETAVAAAMGPLMRGMALDTIDLVALETENFAAPAVVGHPRSRSFVKLGGAIEGLELRIVDAVDGRPLVEREVGELELRGTSVTTGYYKRPEATAASFREDGWMRTGDLAYIVDGELVVCGRKKDVIIVGGRNVWPEDIERAVNDVPGVRPGNVIAFGVEGRFGKEGIVVVAETKAGDDAALEDVRASVSLRVRDAIGLPANDIALIGAGTMPKTSSGKLQRSECKARYLNGTLTPVTV